MSTYLWSSGEGVTSPWFEVCDGFLNLASSSWLEVPTWPGVAGE